MFDQFTMRSGCRAARLLAVAVTSFVAVVLVTSLPVRADVTWTLSASNVGDWSVASNWGGTLPTGSDNAYINSSGTVMVTQLGETCGNLSLGSSNGSGTVQVAGGSLFTVNNQYVGNSGMGAVTQSSGTNSIGYLLYLGYDPGSSGMYSLSGSGQISASVELIGSSGTATFTQSGGTNGIGDSLVLGYNAGSNGTYNFSGSGQVSPAYEDVGGSGTGTFTQSGGANSIRYNLCVGCGTGSSGTFNLSGSGQVSAAYENVGLSGTGTFTQSGGTDCIGNALTIGYQAGSNGTYSLSGSGQLSALIEWVGYDRTGTFTQTGGTNMVLNGGTLSLGYASYGSSGTYNLNGGILILSSLAQGFGSAVFNFSGGTLQAGSSFSTSLPMTLGASGGGATFDTAGFAVTLSGSLSGPGSLTKVDSGTLILSASNSYTGDTMVNNGTLTIDYPYLALASNVWVDNSGFGGTLDLNYNGTDRINALYINGVEQAAGLWGGPSSGAPNTSPYLAGTGELVVGVPEPSTAALLGAGVVGLIGWAGWRRSKEIKAYALKERTNV